MLLLLLSPECLKRIKFGLLNKCFFVFKRIVPKTGLKRFFLTTTFIRKAFTRLLHFGHTSTPLTVPVSNENNLTLRTKRRIRKIFSAARQV